MSWNCFTFPAVAYLILVGPILSYFSVTSCFIIVAFPSVPCIFISYTKYSTILFTFHNTLGCKTEHIHLGPLE